MLPTLMKWKIFSMTGTPKKGRLLLGEIIHWRSLTLWEGYGVDQAIWESCSSFLLPNGRLNSVVVEYVLVWRYLRVSPWGYVADPPIFAPPRGEG